MDWTEHHLPIHQTGYFSRIITDYLDEADALRPLYAWFPDGEGLRRALEARKTHPVDRATLVAALREQYRQVPGIAQASANVAALAGGNTFTVCTAHQPAIFTGHLYFIYKILHTIRLADQLAKDYPEFHFVPVFYMGSED